jgi:hypothetical protein
VINSKTIERWLATSPFGLDVVIFGQVFGGRPGEAPQSFKSFELDADVLTMRFNTTETLKIFGADSIKVNEFGNLVIPTAEKIVWGWHSYGATEVPANWCTDTFILREDGDVDMTVAGVIRQHLSRFGNPDKKYIKPQDPALQLMRFGK